MKKSEKIAFALIAILAVGWIASMVQISNLQWRVENTQNGLHHFSNVMGSQISLIFGQMGMLNRQMSLIEIASTDISAINIDSLTADLSFTLIPKQVTPYTAVGLDFGGEIIPMQRDGQMFTATVSRDIFGDVRPMILIDEAGTINTTQDSRIGMWSIMHEIFPTMHPSFSGTSSHGNGRLRMNGHITVLHDRLESMPIEFLNFRLIEAIDGVVTNETEIPFDEAMEWPLERNISLADDQTLVLSVIATDSVGLEHHTTVWTIGTRVGTRDMPRALTHGHDLRIYHSDGTLLWERELFWDNDYRN